MPDKIGHPEICRMLQGAVAQIRGHHQRLSQLDSAVGDGDHGTTMLRSMEAVEKTITENEGADLKTLFGKIGLAVMSCDGGSTGPLLGCFFMGLSEASEGRRELDLAGLRSLFESGIARVQKQSRAQVGDKTMMDAFLPALAALKAAGRARCPSVPQTTSNDIKAALQQAAGAAAQGAEATRNMRAKFGRARHLGDRVFGHLDPGAVSVSLMFKGFAEAL